MKRSRFSDGQIFTIVKEQEAGAKTADVCRKHGISDATFCKWKAKYGGLEISEALGLKVRRRGGRKREPRHARSDDGAAANPAIVLYQFALHPPDGRYASGLTRVAGNGMSGDVRCCWGLLLESRRRSGDGPDGDHHPDGTPTYLQ